MKVSKKLRVIVTAIAAMTILLAMGMTASAKMRIVPQTFFAGSNTSTPVNFEDINLNAKLVSIKSSKPGVIRAVKTGNELWSNYLEPLKKGKSKITVTYKLNGKKYKISATYTVKAYPAPFKSITVNGKKVNLKDKNNRYSTFYSNYKKSTAKVKLSLKKGWKLTYLNGERFDKNYNNMNKQFTVKNNKSFKVRKNEATHVGIMLENKKGEIFYYYIDFQRF